MADDGTMNMAILGLGCCRFTCMFVSYLLAFVAFVALKSSDESIVWWIDPEKPGSVFNTAGNQRCYLASEDSWQVGVEGGVDTGISIQVDLGRVQAGVKDDYCGFSMSEVFTAVKVRQRLEQFAREHEGFRPDNFHCLKPFFCRRFAATDEYQETCKFFKENTECFEFCHGQNREAAVLALGIDSTGGAQGSWPDGSTCSDRERHITGLFQPVPEDVAKAAAFYNHVQMTTVAEAMDDNSAGIFLIIASVVGLLLWCVRLGHFLVSELGALEADAADTSKEVANHLASATLGVVTTVLPVAVMKPLAGLQSLPEPLEDKLLIKFPSVYSDMLVGVFLAAFVAVPCICCGCGLMHNERQTWSIGPWLLSFLVLLFCAVLVLRSYWYDGFFLYVDWSAVFSFEASWSVAIMADVVQLFFFCTFFAELLNSALKVLRWIRKKSKASS